MSVFGNHAPADVLDAAEKFIGKMDERDLVAAIEQSDWTKSADGRSLLAESIFDAFRQRGESSEDAAEGAGTTLDAIARTEVNAVQSLLLYAQANPGLLKEATLVLIERQPDALAKISPMIAQGVAQRLRDR